jgi:hypothetical protein
MLIEFTIELLIFEFPLGLVLEQSIRIRKDAFPKGALVLKMSLGHLLPMILQIAILDLLLVDE